jgi:DNA replication protein DnaC
VKREYRQRVFGNLREKALPEFTLKDLKTDVFKPENRAEVSKFYEVTEAAIGKFPYNKRSTVFLTGKAGTGKTYLSIAAANSMQNRGFSVVFVTAFELNDRFLQYHTSPYAARTGMLDDVLNCDMLVIDDLGAAPVVRNVTCEYLIALLDKRKREGRLTLVTSNYSGTDFTSKFGDRIYSRLVDKRESLVFNFSGSDLRLN